MAAKKTKQEGTPNDSSQLVLGAMLPLRLETPKGSTQLVQNRLGRCENSISCMPVLKEDKNNSIRRLKNKRGILYSESYF